MEITISERKSPDPLSATPVSVGELLVRALEHWGVTHAFGVISIHNMPMLDPLGARGAVAFIAARGEAGAVNMADAFARVSGRLGVVFTSTGTAAGNAAGALVEALTAGTPILHVTGQVEREHLGRGRGYIHEAPAQFQMLKAISKAAYTLTEPGRALEIFLEAASFALSAPMGPVSIEIPIDVQSANVHLPEKFPDLSFAPRRLADPASVDRLGVLMSAAKRPVLMLGGGSKSAANSARILADKGVCVVSSTNGRGVVPEDDPMTLGAFNCTPQIQAFYRTCDLMIVAGSRLRGNETWTYELELPKPTVVIDIDPAADGRSYPNDLFINGDCALVLRELVGRLPARLDLDPNFLIDITALRKSTHATLRRELGPYVTVVDAVQAALPTDAAWVRDVTISNSMWGNRYLRIGSARMGVHAVGGGIGQGLPMGIGASFAAPSGAVILSGDGGLTLCLGELATAADTGAPLTLILMNDAGYGVIRNIQDARYGGRQFFSNIKMPDFALVSQSLGIAYFKVERVEEFAPAFRSAIALKSPAIVEIDMVKIGPYAHAFAGPVSKTVS